MLRVKNHIQKPLVSSKVPMKDLKSMKVLRTFDFDLESQNLEYKIL